MHWPALQDQVAKVYHRPPTTGEADKIEALMALASPSLLSVAALPVDRLNDDTGQMVGYVMPRVMAHAASTTFTVRVDASRTLPIADFRFLVHVAINIARCLPPYMTTASSLAM